MSPIKKARISEGIIDAIKQMIVADSFNPGDKFYSEKELTQKLNVSRSSLREAVRILEVTGQVNVKHGKGIFIADTHGRHFEEFSSWIKQREQLIKDNYEIRLIIEPKAAGQAAERATAADIRKMENACSQFLQATQNGNIEEAVICDHRFHRTLAGGTKNKTLYILMKAMIVSFGEGWISCLSTPGRIELAASEHAYVLGLIKKRDRAGAENAMTRHLVNALHDITAHLDKELP